MKDKSRRINASSFIYGILIVSIIVNMFLAKKSYNYKYLVGEQSYIETENIRHKNEVNMNIIINSVDSKSITNQELLQLHKNYEDISNSVIELYQQYNQYEKSSSNIFLKKLTSNSTIQNDVHGLIKEYTLSTLNNEMKNEHSKLVLDDRDLECFKSMEKMSRELNDYFIVINNEKFSDISSEMKKNKIIKNEYWIDILNNIDSITEQYVEVDWNITCSDI